jgi:hypothetical protein
LVCWAGYTPTETDLEVIYNHHKPRGSPEYISNVIATLRETFIRNPRSLLNSANLCIRRILCDNVFYKVKLLNVPKGLENIITLANVVP